MTDITIKQNSVRNEAEFWANTDRAREFLNFDFAQASVNIPSNLQNEMVWKLTNAGLTVELG